MSYARMDHAAWVQLKIEPYKRSAERRAAPKDRGKGWRAAPDTLSEFQAKVFDILGMTFGGIYNARISWDAVDWRCGHGIGVPMRSQELSTFDFNELTSLVFLCHEARIRCCVSAHGVGGVMIQFHPRVAAGGMGRRHPNLDESVASFREWLPKDHRIFYRELEQAQAAGDAA